MSATKIRLVNLTILLFKAYVMGKVKIFFSLFHDLQDIYMY